MCACVCVCVYEKSTLHLISVNASFNTIKLYRHSCNLCILTCLSLSCCGRHKLNCLSFIRVFTVNCASLMARAMQIKVPDPVGNDGTESITPSWRESTDG